MARAGLHGRRRAVAGSRNWRQHRHFLAARSGVAAIAPHRRSGTIGSAPLRRPPPRLEHLRQQRDGLFLPDVPRPAGPQQGFQRRRRARRRSSEHPRRRGDRDCPGGNGDGKLFRRARHPASLRPRVPPGGRHRARLGSCRGSRKQLLASPLRGQSRDRRANDSGEQSSDDGNRRPAARLPRSAGRSTGRSVRSSFDEKLDLAPMDRADGQRLGGPPGAVAERFRPPRPRCFPGAGGSRHGGDLSPDPRGGVGHDEAPGQPFPRFISCQEAPAFARRARHQRVARSLGHAVDRVDGAGRFRPVDRVRQRGESSDRSSRRTPPRDRHSNRRRREPHGAHPPASNRELATRLSRRRARSSGFGRRGAASAPSVALRFRRSVLRGCSIPGCSSSRSRFR